MGKSYTLCLYIAGSTSAGKQSVRDVKRVLKKSSLDYTLEVVDILKNPQMALKNGVVATPTLIKTQPLPVQHIVGRIDNVLDLEALK